MATARRWIARTSAALAIALPVVAIVLYAVNPFGVKSYDPRQRITGFGIYRIPSASMLPTLSTGSIVFVNAGYYRDHAPARGDVVVFAPSQHPDQDWIKRIVGMPGDRVGYHDNVVSIDGKPLGYARVGAYRGGADAGMAGFVELREDLPGRPHGVLESEAAAFEDPGEGDWQVPPNHYFMIGDNRDRSDDSRFWGPLPASALKGRVVGR